MAIIPKKSKTTNISNSMNLEIALVIFTLYIVIDQFTSNLISTSLSIPFSIFTILLVIYMVLGNKKNKGRIGYERIIIFVRFKAYKFLEWRSKHVYKSEVIKNENKEN